ncbi:MAG: hypothetical protein PW844_20575 [Pantoea sp.]|uniref:hypothetical protein n=1 Tax=Pantoea sp. TaxID=69393 RepID=UPI00238945C2|nr:hypothetical protein [Pantoea sp.]MDE1188828.1 hypothetical protein [Pantoea sp.]
MQTDLVPRLIQDWQKSDELPVQQKDVPVQTSPVVCRAEIGLSPDSIRALGNLADHLPAAGMFLLLMTMSIVLIRVGRICVAMLANKPGAMSVRYGTPVSAPATFGSREMAERVAEHETTAYWQHLLDVFSTALEDEGYTLHTDERAEVSPPLSVRVRVGRELAGARQYYLAPLTEQYELMDERLREDADKHFLLRADTCQRGVRAAGWYVVRRDDLSVPH